MPFCNHSLTVRWSFTANVLTVTIINAGKHLGLMHLYWKFQFQIPIWLNNSNKKNSAVGNYSYVVNSNWIYYLQRRMLKHMVLVTLYTHIRLEKIFLHVHLVNAFIAPCAFVLQDETTNRMRPPSEIVTHSIQSVKCILKNEWILLLF